MENGNGKTKKIPYLCSLFFIDRANCQEDSKVCALFLSICPPPGFIPVLGLLERYMMPTLDSALLYSSRAGADPGRLIDKFIHINSSMPQAGYDPP